MGPTAWRVETASGDAVSTYCHASGAFEQMYCVFCHFTEKDCVDAYTIMNGHAVCRNHAEHGAVQGGGTFAQIVMYLPRSHEVTP